MKEVMALIFVVIPLTAIVWCGTYVICKELIKLTKK
jgi:hypothetical protein